LRLHASISDCKGGSTLVRDYTNLISLLCLGVFFGCVSVSWFSHASIVTHKTMAGGKCHAPLLDGDGAADSTWPNASKLP